jgi:hypothetical protein
MKPFKSQHISPSSARERPPLAHPSHHDVPIENPWTTPPPPAVVRARAFPEFSGARGITGAWLPHQAVRHHTASSPPRHCLINVGLTRVAGQRRQRHNSPTLPRPSPTASRSPLSSSSPPRLPPPHLFSSTTYNRLRIQMHHTPSLPPRPTRCCDVVSLVHPGHRCRSSRGPRARAACFPPVACGSDEAKSCESAVQGPSV